MEFGLDGQSILRNAFAKAIARSVRVRTLKVKRCGWNGQSFGSHIIGSQILRPPSPTSEFLSTRNFSLITFSSFLFLLQPANSRARQAVGIGMA
jgi:hypothetical protein